jgi:hypothetical protein
MNISSMKSFIGIIKPFSETALSNLLAYYFDRNGDHGFGTLFLNALSGLLTDKRIDFNLSDDQIEKDAFEVLKEVITDKGNFIDLLIRFKHRQRSKSWAIIIENKIKHSLVNDLEDYWKDCDYINDENKILIVLSAKIENVTISRISNICYLNHLELKNSVQEYYTDTHPGTLSDIFLNEYFKYIDELFGLHLTTPEIRAIAGRNGVAYTEGEKLSILQYAQKVIFNFIEFRNVKRYGNRFRGLFTEAIRYDISLEIDPSFELNVKLDIDTVELNSGAVKVSLEELKSIYETALTVLPGWQSLYSKNYKLTPNDLLELPSLLKSIFEDWDQKELELYRLILQEQKKYFNQIVKEELKKFTDNYYDVFLNQDLDIFPLDNDPTDLIIHYHTFRSILCHRLQFHKDKSITVCLCFADIEELYVDQPSLKHIEETEIVRVTSIEKFDNNYFEFVSEANSYSYVKLFTKEYKLQRIEELRTVLSGALDEFIYFLENYTRVVESRDRERHLNR